MSAHLFSRGGANREQFTVKEYLLYTGVALLFFALIVLSVYELHYFNQTLEQGRLFLIALVFGLVLGGLWGKAWQSKASDLTEKVQIYIFCLVVVLFFSPLAISLLNRKADFRKPVKKDVFIRSVTAEYSERYGRIKGQEKPQANIYKVCFVLEEEDYCIPFYDQTFRNAQRGDLVTMLVHKGALGIGYFEILR